MEQKETIDVIVTNLVQSISYHRKAQTAHDLFVLIKDGYGVKKA